MKNPYVVSLCGHSFEKEWIHNWMAKKLSCPVCCIEINPDNVTENVVL